MPWARFLSSAQAGWRSRFATMCRQVWMPASIVSGFRCLSFPRLHRIGVVVSHTHQLLLRQALVWPLFVILCSCTWHVLPRLSLCCGSKLIVAAGPKGNRFKDYQPQHAQRTQCRHASPALPNRACCKQRRELHIPCHAAPAAHYSLSPPPSSPTAATPPQPDSLRMPPLSAEAPGPSERCQQPAELPLESVSGCRVSCGHCDCEGGLWPLVALDTHHAGDLPRLLRAAVEHARRAQHGGVGVDAVQHLVRKGGGWVGLGVCLGGGVG